MLDSLSNRDLYIPAAGAAGTVPEGARSNRVVVVGGTT